LLIQALRRNSIELGEVSVQYDFLRTDEEYRLLDALGDNYRFPFRHVTLCL
jgi:hypothetical protein